MTSAPFRLAAECCRHAFAAGDGAAIAELGAAADWSRFLPTVRFHRVQGLVWSSLRSVRVAPPPEIEDALSSDARAIVASNLAIATECGELCAEFEKAEIPLLFLKGLTVGALAYPKPLLKMGWDIDLLIGPGRLADAVRLLRDRGYRQVFPGPGRNLESWHRRRKESVWSREPGLHVELHTRLADNLRLIPRITVDSPRQSVEIMPGVSLPTLSGDELFAYLCVHGASSAWFRLKWITDLAAILHPLDASEIERLYDRSQRLGAARAAAQALLLADALYGTLRDGELKRTLERDSKSRWLAAAAYRQVATNVAEPTAALFGTARIHWTQLLLKPGPGFKLREFARQVTDAVA